MTGSTVFNQLLFDEEGTVEISIHEGHWDGRWLSLRVYSVLVFVVDYLA